jgi:hypothetical protein
MISLFTAFFYPAFLGFLALSVMLRGTSFRNRVLFLWGSSFPVGAGLCSLILFASHLIFAPGAKLISLSLSLMAIVFLLGYYISGPKQNLPREHIKLRQIGPFNQRTLLGKLPSFLSFLLFVATFLVVLQYYSLAAPMDIFGGGDIRYFWSLKAKFFFRDPTAWQGMFSPKLFWTHTDYPLLVPGILAWGWNWLGHESLFWLPFISLGFYVSCVLILVWYLSSYVSWTTGWIGGTFFLVLKPYLYWATFQYVDVPLTFFITACGLTFMAALRSDQKRVFIVSGLLGGLAAWTKNEGLSCVVFIYVLLGGICASRYYKKTKRAFMPLLEFSLGALLPLLAVGVIKFFFDTHGDYFVSGRTLRDYQGLIFSGWDKTFTILKAFYTLMTPFEEWKGLWFMFIAAAIASGARKKEKRGGFIWILFWIVALMNLGYLFIFHITPHNLAWHIKFSLNRLLLHSGGLALAFSFESLTFTRKKIEDPLSRSPSGPHSAP